MFVQNYQLKSLVVILAFLFFAINTNKSKAEKFWNGDTYTVEIPGSGTDNLLLKARYTIFIPNGITKIKGILIHQHGCGVEGWGKPIGTDAQYQAFAKKWSLAIMGPDLYPKPGRDCLDWVNPADGSGNSLLYGIDSLARHSGHNELNNAPWVLWGHSGGAYWVLAMTQAYPEKVLATFAYSPGLDPAFVYPIAAAKIPVMIRHAGANDFNAPGIDCWGTSLRAFSKLRGMNGLVSIAYNANQNHNYSFVRNMAIPFYESVLAQRLPVDENSPIRDMDNAQAWLADTITTGTPNIYRASAFSGNPLSMSWLPDSVCAAKFKEYLMTGTVKDITPPPAPSYLELIRLTDSQDAILKWQADADVESGIKYFNIYINGKFYKRYPEYFDFQTFDTNLDCPSPERQPLLVYNVSDINSDTIRDISISTVNNYNLESSQYSINIPYIIKIANQTNELVSCIGTENNYILCNAEVNGGIKLDYQWYKDGIEIQGESKAILYFPVFNFRTSGIYKCKVFADGSAEPAWTSDIPVYSVKETEITNQPVNQTAYLNESVVFSFEAHVNGKNLNDAVANDGVKVQWYKYESDTKLVALNDKMPGISGAKSNRLTITNINNENFGKYQAEITGLCGTVKTDIVELKHEVSDIIIKGQTLTSLVCTGNESNISVLADSKSGEEIKYQWYKGTIPLNEIAGKIEGVHSNRLNIYNIQISDAGEYFLNLFFDNSPDFVQSRDITITVMTIPEIISQPKSVSLKAGGKLFLETVAANPEDNDVNYQWFHNGILIDGANYATYIKIKSSAEDAGEYLCKISNYCGEIQSKAAVAVITENISGINENISGGYWLGEAAPAPVSGISAIKYYLPEMADVKISISDLQGNSEKILSDKFHSPGEYSIDIDINKLNLSSGIYFLKLESNGIVLVRKISVVK